MPALWPIPDGRGRLGVVSFQWIIVEVTDGKEEPKEPPWSASSIARTFLPHGSNLRKAVLRICLLMSVWNFLPGQVWKSKSIFTKGRTARYKSHSGPFSCLEQGPFAFWLGHGSVHFSGPAHTCHPSHLSRLLSSVFPNKALITLSGTVVISLGCTLESSG